jgi:flagella synthesis protein FlgN
MQSSIANIAEGLKQESDSTRQLIQLLKREQAELIKADIEGLIILAEEKAKVVAILTELTQRRYNVLASVGFQPMESGMQDWLNNHASHSPISQAWNELLSLAKTAKDLNRTNGLLINRQLANNKAALNILQGNVATSNFYGPNGQSSALNSRTRNLIIG